VKLTVKNIDRTWVNLPFREVTGRNMIRELPHWTILELCQVTLDCGVTGYGETMPFYTWMEVTDASVGRAIGKCATEIMWDDSLGGGLQMALFDAVAQANEIPIYQLFGRKIRERAPVSWWSVEMPVEDWLSECRDAIAAGYTSYKMKARPWFDQVEQMATIDAETPDYFEIDLDFNTMLCDSAHAVRVLEKLEKYEKVKIFESPISQKDVAGNKYIRAHTNVPIAMHVGNPPLTTALEEGVCDGFVVNGGVSQVLHEANCIAEKNKVFWLQNTGSGISTVWCLHLAAVLSHARWPAVNCHNLYQHHIFEEPFHVQGGQLAIPDGPGLGYSIDWNVVEQHRIEPIPKPYPYPDLLIRVNWPSGDAVEYAHGVQYWHDFIQAFQPVFSPGVNMEVVPNDGSDDWRRRYAEALKKPSWDMRQN